MTNQINPNLSLAESYKVYRQMSTVDRLSRTRDGAVVVHVEDDAWATDGAMLIRLGSADEFPEAKFGFWRQPIEGVRESVVRLVGKPIPENVICLHERYIGPGLRLLRRFSVCGGVNDAKIGYVQDAYLWLIRKHLDTDCYLCADSNQSMIYCVRANDDGSKETVALFMPLNNKPCDPSKFELVNDPEEWMADRAFYGHATED